MPDAIRASARSPRAAPPRSRATRLRPQPLPISPCRSQLLDLQCRRPLSPRRRRRRTRPSRRAPPTAPPCSRAPPPPLAHGSAAIVLSTGAASPTSRAAGGLAPPPPISHGRPASRSSSIDGRASGILLAEGTDVRDGIVEAPSAIPRARVTSYASSAQLASDVPSHRVVEHARGSGARGSRRSPLKADVADQAPDSEPLDRRRKTWTRKPALDHVVADPLDPRRRRPVSLAEPHELPAVVVHVSRPHHRGAEPARDALIAHASSPRSPAIPARGVALRPFWIGSTTVSRPRSGFAVAAAASTFIALVAITTRSQAPSSASPRGRPDPHRAGSPLAPVHHEPSRADRCPTCSAMPSTAHTSLLPASPEESGVHLAHLARADIAIFTGSVDASRPRAGHGLERCTLFCSIRGAFGDSAAARWSRATSRRTTNATASPTAATPRIVMPTMVSPTSPTADRHRRFL